MVFGHLRSSIESVLCNFCRYRNEHWFLCRTWSRQNCRVALGSNFAIGRFQWAWQCFQRDWHFDHRQAISSIFVICAAWDRSVICAAWDRSAWLFSFLLAFLALIACMILTYVFVFVLGSTCCMILFLRQLETPCRLSFLRFTCYYRSSVSLLCLKICSI